MSRTLSLPGSVHQELLHKEFGPRSNIIVLLQKLRTQVLKRERRRRTILLCEECLIVGRLVGRRRRIGYDQFHEVIFVKNAITDRAIRARIEMIVGTFYVGGEKESVG